MPPDKPGPGDPAPDLTLRDDSNQSAALSDLWRRKPTVLLFVRHFG